MKRELVQILMFHNKCYITPCVIHFDNMYGVYSVIQDISIIIVYTWVLVSCQVK